MLSLWGSSAWLLADPRLRNPLNDSCMGRGSYGAGGRTPTGSASNPSPDALIGEGKWRSVDPPLRTPPHERRK